MSDYSPLNRWEEPCKHLAVMPDPILEDWCCTRCLKPFAQIPDVDKDLPRMSSLWDRIKWAFRPRKKVAVVSFVWTVQWAKARETTEFTMNKWQRHWGKSREFRPSSREDARKLYTHPSNREKP